MCDFQEQKKKPVWLIQNWNGNFVNDPYKILDR